MSLTVFKKFYSEPPICEKEILRYAGCKKATPEINALLKECIELAEHNSAYKVCYCELPCDIKNNTVDLGVLSLKSDNLAINLSGCKKVILFAATIGIGIDRLISRYNAVSPAKAVILQAYGTERIEALCDAFCEDIKKEYKCGIKPRFSPGYGDLDINCQKDIFSLLDCERKIGLTLNSSLLMSPTKSVTAFVGLDCHPTPQKTNKCNSCNMKNCEYRGAL